MNRTRHLIAPGIAILLTLGSGIAVAHTAIDQQIMMITQRIETSPGDYRHLLKRHARKDRKPVSRPAIGNVWALPGRWYG